MTEKQLQKAFTAYRKTGNLKPLAGTLVKLVLYMAERAKRGYEVKFLSNVPFIIDSLKSLDLKKKK